MNIPIVIKTFNFVIFERCFPVATIRTCGKLLFAAVFTSDWSLEREIQTFYSLPQPKTSLNGAIWMHMRLPIFENEQQYSDCARFESGFFTTGEHKTRHTLGKNLQYELWFNGFDELILPQYSNVQRWKIVESLDSIISNQITSHPIHRTSRNELISINIKTNSCSWQAWFSKIVCLFVYNCTDNKALTKLTMNIILA